MTYTRRQLLTLAAATPLIGIIGRAASAGTPPVYQSRGIAVDGSDVVAYHTLGRPTSGSDEISHDWMGVTWRFSTIEHRDLFAADPARYAPQYGGYCAYAVSEGYTASTIPEAWKIVDGKLYLNFSRRVQRRWERDIPGRIAAADANWPAVLSA